MNVTLDAEHAANLNRLAKRTQIQEGTLARSLLSQALDEADIDPRNVVDLDGIAGAFERAREGLERARAGETVSLDDLLTLARIELSARAVEDLETSDPFA